MVRRHAIVGGGSNDRAWARLSSYAIFPAVRHQPEQLGRHRLELDRLRHVCVHVHEATLPILGRREAGQRDDAQPLVAV